MEERKVLKHPLGEMLWKSINAVRLQPPIYIGKHRGSPCLGNFIQVTHRIKLKIKI